MSERPPLPDDLLADIDQLAPYLTLLDHYAVLGVQESATDKEIKAAYLHVIQRFHPDRWQARESGAHRKRMEAIFARATEAYEVLRYVETRLDYDRSLYEVRGIPRPSHRPETQPKAPAPAPAPAPAAMPARIPRAPSAIDVAKAARMLEQLRPQAASARFAAPKAAPAAPPTPAPVPPPRPSTPTATPPTTSATAAAPGRPTVLVVEDDDTLRRMLVRILGELGAVREARDGAEALELARQGPIPSLIVSDLMMPRMDGLELARRLKSDPRTSRIPIVMLTARAGAKDLIEGVNAGARFYVTKPFKVDDLKAKARKAMTSGSG